MTPVNLVKKNEGKIKDCSIAFTNLIFRCFSHNWRRTMKLVNTTVFEGVLLLIIGFASIIEADRLINIGKDYSHDIFGPGKYLFGIGLVLIILGLIFIFQRGEKLEGEKIVLKKEASVKMLGMIIALPVYTLLIPVIGYFIATAIF
jgi:hypothetical protein